MPDIIPKGNLIQSPSFGWEESLAVQTQAKLCQLEPESLPFIRVDIACVSKLYKSLNYTLLGSGINGY